MDTHTRIVAVLHILFGLLGAFLMLLGALAVGGIGAFVEAPDVPAFVFGLGASVFIVLALFAVAESVAGFFLLKGSATARIFVIVFGVLGLFNFPFGTALGIYTLWALLRKQPIPLQQ